MILMCGWINASRLKPLLASTNFCFQFFQVRIIEKHEGNQNNYIPDQLKLRDGVREK
jgi:hypothetical protein